MAELAAWLEASALARLLRAGVWLYPLVNVAHVVGVALLLGAVTVLDLRLAGLWRSVPLRAIAHPTVRVAAGGFGLAAASGAALLSVHARDYLANPMLYLKFSAIALAGINALAVHRSPAWTRPDHDGRQASARRLAMAGIGSLACWLVAVTAGRMIAYW